MLITIDYTPRVKEILKDLEYNSHLWDNRKELEDIIWENVYDDLYKATNLDIKLIDDITKKILKEFEKTIDKNS